MMNPDEFYEFEAKIFEALESKLSLLSNDADRTRHIETMAKIIFPPRPRRM